MRSYAGRLQLALIGLAIPAVVLAGLGWLVLEESRYRVERGRIASDIYTALMTFELEKAALRNWSYRRALDQPADAAERVALLDQMRQQIDAIAQKAALAAALDHDRGKVLPEHDDRLAMLDFLNDVARKLERETQLLGDDGPSDPAQLAVIDAGFDQLRGIALAEALTIALSSEAQALRRERDRADQGLTAARHLFLSAGGFGLVATLIMALFLGRRLRQPLRELDKGLRAYARGDFSYRFTRFHDTEFIGLGEQLNGMAIEVEAARGRAAQHQADLEQRVASRTLALRRTLDELAASEGARQKLLADIGHELRTPVTVIRGEAQVALRLKSSDSGTYRAALGRIVDVTRQMGHLIEDLLVLVRDPDGQPMVTPRDICLSDALRPALDAAQSLARQGGLMLEAPDPLPRVSLRADPDRVRQVVTCLLDNALRYSHPGGRVTVKVPTPASGRVLLQITDEGIGMDSADLTQAFHRGWRSDAARRHRPDGLGLGLAIARQLTEAQGGHLAIRPGPVGCGVVAELTLPLHPAAQSGEG